MAYLGALALTLSLPLFCNQPLSDPSRAHTQWPAGKPVLLTCAASDAGPISDARAHLSDVRLGDRQQTAVSPNDPSHNRNQKQLTRGRHCLMHCLGVKIVDFLRNASVRIWSQDLYNRTAAPPWSVRAWRCLSSPKQACRSDAECREYPQSCCSAELVKAERRHLLANLVIWIKWGFGRTTGKKIFFLITCWSNKINSIIWLAVATSAKCHHIPTRKYFIVPCLSKEIGGYSVRFS